MRQYWWAAPRGLLIIWTPLQHIRQPSSSTLIVSAAHFYHKTVPESVRKRKTTQISSSFLRGLNILMAVISYFSQSTFSERSSSRFDWMLMRFQVLAAASTKTTVFWDAASCSLIEVHRRFRGVWCVGKVLTDNTSHRPRRQISSDMTTSSVSTSCSRLFWNSFSWLFSDI
jgi:hypothetical protein